MPTNNIPKLDFGDNMDQFSDNETYSSLSNLNAEQEESKILNLLALSLDQRKRHYIYREYVAIAKDPIEGIYVVPSSTDILEWFGLLIVRAGTFCGGMFRFTLTLPADFPDTKQVPLVKFEENLFHPLINCKTNYTDLTRYFPSGWQRDRNHIYQVLTATQGMFFRCKVEAGQAANPEAAILLTENPIKFKQMARDVVRRSRTQIYDLPNSDDPNAIRFIPWNESEMKPLKEYLLGKRSELNKATYGCIMDTNKNTHNNGKKLGYSWVENCHYMCDILPVISINNTQPTNNFK